MSSRVSSLLVAAATLSVAVRGVFGAVDADLVESIPGFEDVFASEEMTFKTYSGYLAVDLSDAGLAYEALSIHYEFHTCVKGETECPVAVWHQGGPGGSAVFGSWTEMGPFQMMSQGPVSNLEHAWNNAANMLYLESPAGSHIAEADAKTGFSKCFVTAGGAASKTCEWNDTTQAVAYARTLKAFFDAFPEFLANDLYLVGESYAGQFIPNIAYYLVQNPTVLGKNLTGIAVGNGCWGGTDTEVVCNGANSEKHDIDNYHGKGLISDALYDSIQDACDFSEDASRPFVRRDSDLARAYGDDCAALIVEAEDTVGNYNVYNVYDDCPLGVVALARDTAAVMPAKFHNKNDDDNLPPFANKHKRALRDGMMAASSVPLFSDNTADSSSSSEGETDYSSGYRWNCESDPSLSAFFLNASVQEALHLDGPGSGFSYDSSGPASVTLYPTLLKYMRVLIYNGDADFCVPYLGNEEWTTKMAADGYAKEKTAWRPWYSLNSRTYAPSGYVTTYDVPDKLYTSPVGGDDFAFLTIRLAGHMVPQYQPAPALDFFTKFLAGESY